ncbi:MAG: peptidoglycan DD-metalloendopeptidase family protein [Actinomycetota bacterium]|nr:peptidoglycan DD-metalloendopeptidase family protein [Actinomycetota bacterium]
MRRAALVFAAAALALPLGVVASPENSGGYLGPFDPSAVTGEIPKPTLYAYLDAAARWDLDWALLAAVGKIECDHGRLRAAGCWPPGTINHAGARGPMQFLGSTWRASAGRYQVDVAGPPAAEGHGYATDGDGDGIADPWSTYDAVHAAARFLVDLGGRDDPRRAAKGYNAGPANPNPTAGEAYATKVVELIARYHQLAGAGGPGSPTPAVVSDGFALPFDPAGLHAVTTGTTPPRDPEWQLVKPHHSARVAADIPLPVGTTLYALAGGAVTWAGEMGACGYGVAIRHADQHATITYCHLSRVDANAGDVLTAGRPIGRSGGAPGAPGAGNSTGPHLHLQIETPTSRRCPQAMLLGLWRGWPVPTISALRTSGCTYTGNPPPPATPVPVPPDLPIPSQKPA